MEQSIKVVASQIADFVESSTGLEFSSPKRNSDIRVKQKIDGKCSLLRWILLRESFPRMDSEGIDFLQVNFEDGRKLLLTQTLIGFKPIPLTGLDMDRLPKVVTTPDLISVVEAIEEAMNTKSSHPVEVEVLRCVFSAVLEGGEPLVLI